MLLKNNVIELFLPDFFAIGIDLSENSVKVGILHRISARTKNDPSRKYKKRLYNLIKIVYRSVRNFFLSWNRQYSSIPNRFHCQAYKTTHVKHFWNIFYMEPLKLHNFKKLTRDSFLYGKKSRRLLRELIQLVNVYQ